MAARFSQGLRALHSPPSPALPPRFAARLPDRAVAAWLALSAYDRHHLLAVARALEAANLPDDVVTAGLLHDVGKAGRVTVLDRVAHVLLQRFAPTMSAHLMSRSQVPRPVRGLHRLARHAEVGADVMAAAGLPDRVVWLIRHHEHPLADEELRALQRADRQN